MRNRGVLLFTGAVLLCAAGACGDDETSFVEDGGLTDGGVDDASSAPDAGAPSNDAGTAPEDSGADADDGAGDAGCTDVSSDPANCGRCGRACSGGAACVDGHCENEVAGIAISTEVSCARLRDGTVHCFGRNGFGVLGAPPSATVGAPTKVPGLTDVVDISVKAHTACAVKRDGTVWCWGRNSLGELGYAPGAPSPSCSDPFFDGVAVACDHVPRQVAGFSAGVKIVKVRVGENVRVGGPRSATVCALGDAASGGHVYCWGNNDRGLVQAPPGGEIAAPTLRSGISGATDVSIAGTNFSHACAVVAGGSVLCWGANSLGQLGHATDTGDIADCSGVVPCNPNPEPVAGLPAVSSVHAGAESTCALAANEVFCWGWNGFGIYGADSGVGDVSHVPSRVLGLPATIAGMWHGRTTAHAFTPAGELWSWGDNLFGDLGAGSIDPTSCGNCSSAPVKSLAVDVVAVSGDHTVGALHRDGTVSLWGLGQPDFPEACSGQTCNPTPVKVAGLPPP